MFIQMKANLMQRNQSQKEFENFDNHLSKIQSINYQQSLKDIQDLKNQRKKKEKEWKKNRQELANETIIEQPLEVTVIKEQEEPRLVEKYPKESRLLFFSIYLVNQMKYKNMRIQQPYEESIGQLLKEVALLTRVDNIMKLKKQDKKVEEKAEEF